MINRRRPLVRAGLISGAALLGVPVSIILAGAYGPHIPIVGPFGRLLITYLPLILASAALAAVLAVAARGISGSAATTVVLALAILDLGAAALAASQLSSLATLHGASFSIVRQLLPPSTGRPTKREPYATVDGQVLSADVWQPSPTAPGNATKRAAVLFVHGGAFVEGSLGGRPALFTAFAGSGIVVVDVEYRLSPPPRWNDAPADVMCALGWLQRSAATLGIDPNRVVVMGESAGGNLALLVAYAAGTGAIRPSCAGEPSPPAGVIAVAPTADLGGIWTDRTLWAAGRPFPETYIGGTPSDFPDRYREASPESFVRQGGPPTLLITGANDSIVRQERVTPLERHLRRIGTDVQLIVVPFAEHAFDATAHAFGDQLEAVLFPAFVLARS